jgi:hypothetical protein
VDLLVEVVVAATVVMMTKCVLARPILVCASLHLSQILNIVDLSK